MHQHQCIILKKSAVNVPAYFIRSMSAHFPFVQRTISRIADGGPNIPLWNLIDFADPDAIHRISTPDVGQFKAAVQNLRIRGMLKIFDEVRKKKMSLPNNGRGLRNGLIVTFKPTPPGTMTGQRRTWQASIFWSTTFACLVPVNAKCFLIYNLH